MFKRKKNFKSNDDSSSASNSSEEELKSLNPIGNYINNRPEMVQQMFASIRSRHLNMLLPDVLKDVTLTELKSLCVDQLEVMSKKRIRSILSGAEMVSSSGTDDSSTDDEETDVEKEQKSSFQTKRRVSISSIKSSGEEIPEPDSTSVDLLLSEPAVLVETIESDEDFSTVDEEQQRNVLNEEVGCAARLDEMDEPMYNIVFDSSGDENAENASENFVNDVEASINYVGNQAEEVDCQQESFSAADEPKMSSNEETGEYVIQIEDLPCEEAKMNEAVDGENNSATSDEEYDGGDDDSDLEDGEISVQRETKKFNCKKQFFSQENPDLASAEVDFDDDSALEERNIKEVAVKNVVDVHNNQIECVNIESIEIPINIAKTNENPPVADEEVAPSATLEDGEPLDCNLRPVDDDWMQNDQIETNKENVVFVDETDKAVECSYGGEENENGIIVQSPVFPLLLKPPPGIVERKLDADAEDDLEQYDSDCDEIGNFDEELLPPGVESKSRSRRNLAAISQSEAVQAELSSIPTSSDPVDPPKKSTIVPIKTLFRELKAQRLRAKMAKKPKVYTAALPAWSVHETIAPAGPLLPNEEDIQAQKAKKLQIGVPYDSEKTYPEDDEDSKEVISSTFPPKKEKKKSHMLTAEFLAELEKKKQVHKEEMIRKGGMLEKLRARRMEMSTMLAKILEH